MNKNTGYRRTQSPDERAPIFSLFADAYAAITHAAAAFFDADDFDCFR